jgi:hypothetical protein
LGGPLYDVKYLKLLFIAVLFWCVLLNCNVIVRCLGCTQLLVFFFRFVFGRTAKAM